jgi:putative colanic acid biosynthesis acetyltransferase WcaF
MDPTYGALERLKVLKQVPPPSFRNKAARGVWSVVWLLLYRPSLRTMHGWRRFLLRAFGARIERDAKPYPSAKIWAPWNLEMGAESTLGDYVDCYSVARVVLGPKATVSQRAYICTAQRDIDAIGMPLVTGDIVINELAWVAAEAFVAPGVEVGTGGVVAARAVTTKSVPDWTVVAGNPAKPIRYRRR